LIGWQGLSLAMAASAEAPQSANAQLRAAYHVIETMAPTLFNRAQERAGKAMFVYLEKKSNKPAAMVQSFVDKELLPDVTVEDDLRHEFAGILAREFTIEELTQIASFEASAVGQHLNALRPALQEQLYDTEHDWFAKNWSSLPRKHAEGLAGLGLKAAEVSP